MIFNPILLIINSFSYILSLIYFFYPFLVLKKNFLFKSISFLFLILALMSFINIIYLINFEKLNLNIFYLSLFLFFIYFSFLLIISDKNSKILIKLMLLLFMLLNFIIIIFFQIFYIFIYINYILVCIYYFINNYKNKVLTFILSKIYILTTLLSLIISIIFSFLAKFEIDIKKNLNFIFINIFPFIFSTILTFSIRSFMLFSYIGGRWQNILLNNSILPLVIINSQNIIIHANNNFFNLTGYDFEILNKVKIDSILNTEKNILKCKENKIIPVEYKIFSIKTLKNNEKVILIKSIKELIETEIKRETTYDFNLKYSKYFNLFQELLNIYPKGLAFIDSNGNIENINKKFKEIFYYNKENIIIENNIFELFKKLGIFSENEYFNFFDKISKNILKYKDNYYSFKYKNIDKNENHKTKYLLIVSDVSEIQRLKIDIKNKIFLIKEFFNNIYFPMCITDFDGFIKEVNPKFKSIFKNYENKSIFFISKVLCGIFKRKQKELFQDKVVYLGDFVIGSKDMDIIYKVDIKDEKIKNSDFLQKGCQIYSIYCYFIFSGLRSSLYNNELSILFIFINRTEIILNKIELLNLVENSKNLSRRIDILINNINHEIRTPVNIISGLIELLKYEKIEPENQKYLEFVNNNIENINQIINEVISISSYSNEDSNVSKINIIPLFNDYKSYIEKECNFKLKTNLSEIKELKVKINTILFKKLVYFLIQNFKYKENIEFGLFLENFESSRNLDKTNIILYLKSPDTNSIFSLSDSNNEIIKIIIDYIVFLLNGEVKYDKYTLDIKIKIPIKVSKD